MTIEVNTQLFGAHSDRATTLVLQVTLGDGTFETTVQAAGWSIRQTTDPQVPEVGLKLALARALRGAARDFERQARVIVREIDENRAAVEAAAERKRQEAKVRAGIRAMQRQRRQPDDTVIVHPDFLLPQRLTPVAQDAVIVDDALPEPEVPHTFWHSQENLDEVQIHKGDRYLGNAPHRHHGNASAANAKKVKWNGREWVDVE